MAKTGTCNHCGGQTQKVREDGFALVICVPCDFDADECQCVPADGHVQIAFCDDCSELVTDCYCSELGI